MSPCDDPDISIVYTGEDGREWLRPLPDTGPPWLVGDAEIMKNRVLDCIDGRSSSEFLSEREQRLLEKIESGLRNRTDDYRSARGPYRPTPPRVSSPLRRASHPKSALDAFLERSARSWLKAG